jgi:hypothetical protein
MGRADHYVFMDGCVVKGCKPVLALEPTFGEYGALLKELFRRGGWGHSETRGRLGWPRMESFDQWAEAHVHTAQSTQNTGTGADRIEPIVQRIKDDGDIHLFGTSAAGAAILEYFLRCAPQTLYQHSSDPWRRRIPRQKYVIHPHIASFTSIDAPTDWVPLRRATGGPRDNGPGTLGRYLARTTRIKAGPGVRDDEATTRVENVPGTWIGGPPIAGLGYDGAPHYDGLPPVDLQRHMYTGRHMSHETRAFLERVWP